MEKRQPQVPDKSKQPGEQSLEKKMNEVLEHAISTCEAKGWNCSVDSIDEKKWKYASLSVERFISGSGQITGLFNISINGGVQIQLNITSFHGHGLNDLLSSIMHDLEDLPWLEKKSKQKNEKTASDPYAHLERLLRRFHIVSKQLKHRHHDRDTIIIEDEYDVQDLLHSLLKIDFDDVRAEEYTPSYAGSASRMDFLLKKDEIVIEAKMASKNLRDKLVGEQLIIDIKKYQSHPNCKILYCLVYDPNSFITNPAGLENDLTRKHDNLDVKVFIVPH